MRKIFAVLLILTVMLTPSAYAGEGFFNRVYTTETMPAGHWELEQTIRNRTARSFGSYTAFDSRTEVEYGVTDNFQTAFYVNSGYLYARGAPDDDDPNGATGFSRQKAFLQGFSLEFIYRVLNPFTSPVGLAFYFEPTFEFHNPQNGLEYAGTFEDEYKILLQKDFLDDRLIVALNEILETEFIRFKGGSNWAADLDWNTELGATYRFVSRWYGGLEFRNHNEYGDLTHHAHSVFWIGPVIHYAVPRVWATLGFLRQFYGTPSGVDANGTFIGDHLFLRSQETWESTLRLGFPF